MIRKIQFHKIFFTITIAIVILISGCSSQKNSTASPISKAGEDTPIPVPEEVLITTFGPLCKIGLSYIRFPDGSELFLGPETEIEILTIADLSTGTPGYEVLLRHGYLVILSQPPQEIQFTVFSLEGYIAQMAGSLMYVGIEEETGNFKALCVDGVCDLGSDPESFLSLPEGSEGWLNLAGDFQGPFEIDFNVLREGCGENYISVVIPPTPTPDVDATATAFCGDFEEENPGTPCP